jgi:hypothetical protein
VLEKEIKELEQNFKSPFNKSAILDFAKTNQINPAIIQGRYCFETDFYAIKSSIDKGLN